MSDYYKELDESVVEEELKKLKKENRESQEGEEVSVGEVMEKAEEEGRPSTVVLESVADIIQKRFGVDKDAIMRVYKELITDEDPFMRKIAKLIKLSDLARKASGNSELVSSLGEVAVGKVLSKATEKIMKDDEEDEDVMDAMFRKMRKNMKKLALEMMSMAMLTKFMDMMMAPFSKYFDVGQGNNSRQQENSNKQHGQEVPEVFKEFMMELKEEIDRLREELREKKAEERFHEELRKAISSAMEPISDTIKELSKRLEKIESEKEKEKINEILKPVLDRIEKLEVKLSNVGTSPPNLGTFGLGGSIVEQAKAVKAIVDDVKKAVEELKSVIGEKGESVPPEVYNKVQYLENKVRELESKSSLSDIVKTIVEHPEKIRNMVSVARDIMGMVKDIGNSLGIAGGSRPPQEQVAQESVNVGDIKKILAKYEGGESGGEAE